MGGKNSYESIKRYQDKAYDAIPLRVRKGQKDIIKAHAEALGESVNGFIGRAISEAMERDSGGTSTTKSQEAAGTSGGAGGISLSPDVLGAAQAAAEATGEALAAFVARAVQTQGERDKAFLKMGIDPATGSKLKREA